MPKTWSIPMSDVRRDAYSTQTIGRTILTAAVAFVFATISGCGGGGGSHSAPQGTAAATGSAVLKIKWPARPSTNSKLIPIASNAITVTISSNGNEITQQTAARPSDGSDSTMTFHLLPLNKPLDVEASAYPNSDGSGTAQATGNGTLTVADNGQTPSVTVTMASTITQITIEPTAPSTQVGNAVQLTPNCTDADGDIVVVSNSTLSWNTSDATVASVDGNGLVTGVNAGSASISVTDSESKVSGSTDVTVQPSTNNLGGTIYGTVTDTSGNPLGGIFVVTSYGAGDVTATTAADGTYTLESVPAGDRVVTFYGVGVQTTDEVTLALGESVEVDAQLPTSTTKVTGVPVIAVNPPQVDDPHATAVISGTITQMDSSQAVVVVNGSEFLFSINSDGTFSTTVNLSRGTNQVYVRATNALGSTTSPVMTITVSGADSVVGTWNAVLQSGSAIPQETVVLNSDGTCTETYPDGTLISTGTYTYSNGAISFSGGAQYNVTFVSATSTLYVSTIDDRVYQLTYTGPAANLRHSSGSHNPHAHSQLRSFGQR